MTTDRRVHAFGDDALGEDDAVGLVERLQAGRVSAAELVEAAVARLEAVGPTLGGLAHDAYVRARREAAHPRGGFFSGVPTLVKDNSDVAGMPTQHGTDAFAATSATADGDVARVLHATGAVVLGKSQMSEFGLSASAEHPRLGPVRNPWDPRRTAAASSSGAGALVAAGAVPFAHGNDGGGSIRIPAGACGLVGLKPTRGRVPSDKMNREMPLRIVQDGVLTRSVRDTAAFLRESERVYRDLSLPPVGDLTRPGRRRLRVAVATRGLDREIDPGTRALTLATAERLEQLGHHVTDIGAPPVPSGFVDDFLLYWGFLALALTRTGRFGFGPTWRRDRCDALTLGLARSGLRGLPRVPGALRRLRAVRAVTDRLHEQHDVLLSPTVGGPTPLLGHLDPTLGHDVVLDRLVEWVAFTPLQNVTGEPSVSLPLAVTPEGLPQGMMLSAGWGQEAVLVELAYELEEAVGWARIQDPDGP